MLRAFSDGLPYVGTTLEWFSRQVQHSGETRTILGRRVGFDAWEPQDSRNVALPFEKALEVYGSRLKRAYTHKATNYVIQGSASDLMKAGLLKCWQDGIFAATSVPRLIVHDSAEFSVPDHSPSRQAALKEMVRTMETAIKFKVPIRMEREYGPSWGNLYPMD